MAEGNTYKQCGCRSDDGKRLGQQCPKLRRGNGTWGTRHGRWYYQLELPPRADGARRALLRRGGFDTQADCGLPRVLSPNRRPGLAGGRDSPRPGRS